MKPGNKNCVLITGCLPLLLVIGSCQTPPEKIVSETSSPKNIEAAKNVPTAIITQRKYRNPRAKKYMVAAANPLASKAGLEILRKGGSAVDAAIAIQMVLNLVEPQSSGIGGGAFLLHFNNSTGAIDAYDGRETAPASATPKLFLRRNGKPMKFHEAVPGGLSVGIPGLVKMLEIAHKHHGKLPWNHLFLRAINISKKGFKISPRLHAFIKRDKHLKKFPTTRSYFFSKDGKAKPVGSILRNPEFANTLRIIGKRGSDGFYMDEVAEDLIRTVNNSKINPGYMTTIDILGYKAKRREPICMPYRAWFVCGVPPPTSGGSTVLQILGLLQTIKLPHFKTDAVQAIHLITEASRLAFADRNLYISDPDFSSISLGKLISPKYLAKRAKLISKNQSMGRATPGKIVEIPEVKVSPNITYKSTSTSHITVVDERGNVVSMTSSIENPFGSRLMVRGFLLNNQLTDFSFVPEKNGKPILNRVQPGKRPRSSMAPTLVFDKTGKPILAIGSPGGPNIIGYVAKTIIGVLDWNMDLYSAIKLPHFINRNGYTYLESGTFLVSLKMKLEQLGHIIRKRKLNSGLHGISITKTGLEGGADPRREGLAIGD